MRRLSRASLLMLLLIAWLEACTSNRSTDVPPAEPERPTAGEPGREAETRIRFSVPPIAAPAVMKREYGDLVHYLSRALGIPFELVVPSSYADATQKVERGEVEVAILTPLAYVITEARVEGLRVLATPIAQGAPTYAGYILVREDSPYTELTQLEGKTIAFVDRRSTSGFLYPYAHLLKQGIEPEKFFGKIVFKGDHGAVIEALRAKESDAGASFAAATDFIEGPGSAPELRILAKTGRIPYDAVVALPRLTGATAERLRAALLRLSTRTEEGRKVLANTSGINGFLAADDGHYDEIRRVLERVGPQVAIP